MLQTVIFYNYYSQGGIPSDTELHLLDVIYRDCAVTSSERYQINNMRDKWQYNQLCLNQWQIAKIVSREYTFCFVGLKTILYSVLLYLYLLLIFPFVQTQKNMLIKLQEHFDSVNCRVAFCKKFKWSLKSIGHGAHMHKDHFYFVICLLYCIETWNLL